jgi:hypothetical protein
MTEADLPFWEDLNKRLEDLRLKAALLTETLLAVEEVGLAKDAHAVGTLVLSMRSSTENRVNTLKTRATYGKGKYQIEKTFGTQTGRLTTNEPQFQEVPDLTVRPTQEDDDHEEQDS